MRLRTVSQHDPGWRRVRCGKGFRYTDAAGSALSAEEVARVRQLVIPPAWTDVWICPDERGHLQAVGTDDAGRRQYLYHPTWREKRDLVKFERVLAMARKLPRVRAKVVDALGSQDAHARTLALGVRLVDLGCFRPGSDSYADENGSRGLTTLECRHVRPDGGGFAFEFTGKSGVEQLVRIEDAPTSRAIAQLRGRRSPGARFLAVKQGRAWTPVGADALNEYIRELFGGLEVTAKDFRTWHATVTAAVALAGSERAASTSGRAKQIRAAVVQASELLGNTPTVARSSYVHPRVLDLFESGTTLPRVPASQDAADRAVVRLLTP